jgi:hypothetical protein
MTLTTHAVVGAAISSAFGFSPEVALLAGFASHFVLDSFPHWDYKLLSSQKDPNNHLNDDLLIGRDFYFDLIKISFDFLLGLGLAWLFFANRWSANNLAIMAGALGGVLPDFLQFAYMKTKIKALSWMRRWHLYLHGQELDWRPFLTPLVFFCILFGALILGNWGFFTF